MAMKTYAQKLSGSPTGAVSAMHTDMRANHSHVFTNLAAGSFVKEYWDSHILHRSAGEDATPLVCVAYPTKCWIAMLSKEACIVVQQRKSAPAMMLCWVSTSA